MQKLLDKLGADFPAVGFMEGKHFRWSPRNQIITYVSDISSPHTAWALFHELAHAVLQHKSYAMDIELLLMEVAAWDKAKALAGSYDVLIDEEHIQDCLDTYRDWLDRRSTCPACANNSLQQNPKFYRCFNCLAVWEVSSSRFCRPYRQMNRGKKQTSPAYKKQTTFE